MDSAHEASGSSGSSEAARAAFADAIEALRVELLHRLDPAQTAAPDWRAIDWQILFEEARRRVATLGMSERSGEVDEYGLDENLLRRSRALLDFLYQSYWRIDLGGAETLPEHGPCLFVANRAGLLPYDGLMLAHALARERPRLGRVRFLVADWLLELPFVQPALVRLGGVRACRENADRLLGGGHSAIAFPEGLKGAAKIFRDRYRLTRFGRGGVVRTALENRVPLIPIGIVGSEEANPLLARVDSTARPLGLPFLPITPTFPWLGPLGLLPLPSKWVIRVGEALDIEHLEPAASQDELLISRLNHELRGRVQSLVETALADRASIWR